MLTVYRDYVAGYWPLEQIPPGSQLESTYGKIKLSEAEKAGTPGNAGATPNGASASPALRS